MPKVSEEHLAARRRQILDAAIVCFARQGFHGAPMQAIFEEAGLSPGAVYRYFKSKEEIVRAIAEETLGGLVDSLEPGAKGPDELLRQLLDAIDAVDRRDERMRLAVQVWGEASVNPGVGEFVREVFGRLERRIAAGLDAPDPRAAARVLIAIAQGAVVQRNLSQDFDAEGFRTAALSLLGK